MLTFVDSTTLNSNWMPKSCATSHSTFGFYTGPELGHSLNVDSSTVEYEKEQLLGDWNIRMMKYKRSRSNIRYKVNCHPDLFTTEKPISNALQIGPKIREMAKNNDFKVVMRTAFSEVSFLLDNENIDYEITVDVEEDMEYPEWKETVFSIKLSRINQERTIQLWEIIGSNIERTINKMNNKNISNIYETIVLIVTNSDY